MQIREQLPDDVEEPGGLYRRRRRIQRRRRRASTRVDREFNEVTVVYDEVRYVTYHFNQLDELELAYAITVHKSQGSEFPIVIMPVSWFPPMLATRNLLYTGVTRGKRAVVLVGSENKLDAHGGQRQDK